MENKRIGTTPDFRRGRDLLPQDMIKFRHVERLFREEAIRWGYQEVRTPTIEPLSLFTAAGTLQPQMLENLYSFLDWDGWSGERVVLRPEGTIPVSRLFIERLSDKETARLFYISNMFSYDENGTSEHWQCGVELIGNSLPDKAASDGEVALLALAVMKKMGFDAPFLKVGYPPIIREFLKVSGLSRSEIEEVTGLIREKDMEELSRISARKNLDKLPGLMDMTSRSPDFIKNVSAYLPKDPGIDKALREFGDSIVALHKLDVPFEINFGLPLNFEYYTGLVMEVYPHQDRAGKDDSPLASGGRYDGLIKLMSGGEIGLPAVGFALKVDTLIERPEFIKTLATRAVLVRPDVGMKSAREAVSILRDRGFIAEIAGVSQDKNNFRWVLTFDDKSVIVTDSETEKVTTLKKDRIADVPDTLQKRK